MKRLLVLARKSFFTGLLLVLPLVVTLWVLYTGTRLLVSFTAPSVKLAFDALETTPPKGFTEALSLLLAAAALTLLGLVIRSYVGRKVWRTFEGLLLRVPLANPIYSATKKLMEAFQRQKGFQRVVLVEYPRRGCWAVGFITGESHGDLSQQHGSPMFNVFVPTTPNPTSGFLLVVPGNDIIELDMTAEEGITFVMSGGVVSPDLRFKPEAVLAGG